MHTLLPFSKIWSRFVTRFPSGVNSLKVMKGRLKTIRTSLEMSKNNTYYSTTSSRTMSFASRVKDMKMLISLGKEFKKSMRKGCWRIHRNPGACQQTPTRTEIKLADPKSFSKLDDLVTLHDYPNFWPDAFVHELWKWKLKQALSNSWYSYCYPEGVVIESLPSV